MAKARSKASAGNRLLKRLDALGERNDIAGNTRLRRAGRLGFGVDLVGRGPYAVGRLGLAFGPRHCLGRGDRLGSGGSLRRRRCVVTLEAQLSELRRPSLVERADLGGKLLTFLTRF